jgi:hypothetical protein
MAFVREVDRDFIAGDASMRDVSSALLVSALGTDRALENQQYWHSNAPAFNLPHTIQSYVSDVNGKRREQGAAVACLQEEPRVKGWVLANGKCDGRTT